MSYEYAKQIAAYRAIDFIKSNMIVGLGSGSTAEFFIQKLIEKTKSGLSITAVASSKQSERIAKQGGIAVKDINEVSHIDITVDGADEIDTKKRMIKGGGGAHVREKILAAFSKEMIVITDFTKAVDYLGKKKLPIEVLSFGYKTVEQTLHSLSFSGSWRTHENQLFITDNGNFIYDVHIPYPCTEPEKIHDIFLNIPGIIDTGFFFNLAKKVIIGFNNGTIKILE